MVALKWCKKQKMGVKLIEPSINLAKDYIESAEETLIVLKNIQGKSGIWLATTKYYCEYFSMYALLMRLGIKCELHDCTISVAKLLEKENIIPKGMVKTLNYDKKLRIDNQYYLKNRKVVVSYSDMRDFVFEIKNRINTITLDDVEQIRKLIRAI